MKSLAISAPPSSRKARRVSWLEPFREGYVVSVPLNTEECIVYDPFDSPFHRLIQRIQYDQESMRRTYGSLAASDRMKLVPDVESSTYPPWFAYNAIEEELKRQRVTDLAHRDKLLGGSTARFGQALADLAADQTRCDQALGYGFGATFDLLTSLHSASQAADRLKAHAATLSALGGLQDEMARALGMRARIEEAIAHDPLTAPLNDLVRGLSRLTRRATHVWDGLAAQPELMRDIPDVVRDAPTLQVSLATRSTGLIVTADPEFVEDPGILLADASELEEMLGAVDPALVGPYRGALDAFGRRGPDYVRQVTVSLREMYVHLLLKLAPEPAIRAWNAELIPAKGKVPYRAQLTYIFRGLIGSPAYATMIAKDIDHVLQSFTALDGQGVHRLTPELTHEEVRLLITRCEYDLLTVLRVHGIASGSGP